VEGGEHARRDLKDPTLEAGDVVYVRILPGLTDVHGQALRPGLATTLEVPARRTGVVWPSFRVVAPKTGSDWVVPAEYTNANLIQIDRAPVPDSLEARVLETANDWFRLWGADRTTTFFPVTRSLDLIQKAAVPVLSEDDAPQEGTLHLVRLAAVVAPALVRVAAGARARVDAAVRPRDGRPLPPAGRPLPSARPQVPGRAVPALPEPRRACHEPPAGRTAVPVRFPR